jgi:tubulin-folding cofactor B
MAIHIKDIDPHSLSANGGLENVGLVEKYQMSDEVYDSLENTVRAQKRAEATRRASEKAAELAANPPQERPETPRDVAEKYPIGGRCQINPGGRRGEVAYVGKVKGLQGTWIGIRLDEPQGANDGTKDGKRYFECNPKYGSFARVENVEVGDFPEIDPFASDDEDEI